MVMMAEPLCKAIRAHRKEQSPEASHEADEVISKVIYLSPQGKPLTAALCRELATHKHLILVCGHYEGIDQRVIESDIDDEISIGDYVLTNGCLASLVLLDAVVRFVPGVLGDVEAALFDSFEEEGQQGGLLDWPHYTRPELFETKKVPDVLLSGNHKEIAAWRREQAEKKTKEVRPDLWQKYLAKK
jgi:tRNA (guanine37-N1)-methyltransferase